MNDDYKNFVERMGSFEDIFDFSDDEEIQHDEKPFRRIVTRNRSALVNSDSELQHYGVLGMKWGRHINGANVGAVANVGKNSAKLAQEVNKGGVSRKALKSAKGMSDEELKTLTARLNLENNYINATTQQSGKGKVDSILATTGAALAVATSASVLYDVIKKAREVTGK